LRLRRLRRSALAEGELLLVGPTGAGKEIYARAVHALARGKGPFVAVNCAALPAELVESELFGYTRGAHSQASVPKAGLVEAADGGTLFLDEIGDMPREAQAKLLRFLQFREFSPLGATRSRRIDVRIVAATSELRILDTASGPGRGLRRDLASRLGAEPVVLPALRERPEDLLTLAAAGRGGVLPRLTPAALRTLLAYPWPGNVRELAKAIDEATAQSLDEGVVDLRHLPSTILQPAAPPRPVLRRRRAPPRDELEALLRRHEGRVADVARALNRRWSVVWRWLVRHGLEPDDFRVRPGGPVMASRQSRG
jgi:transcriptional regulator with PAS, ATPase and Fis domain